jgi:cell division septal protein FtsQ
MLSLKRKQNHPGTSRTRRRAAPAEPESRRRLTALAGRLTLLLAVGLCAAWVFLRAREFLYESDYFIVRTIEIDGGSPEIQAKIRTALELEDRPLNLLATSLEILRDKTLRIPAVKDVTIRRKLPDTLLVTAEERFPVAILVGEENYLLDTDLVAMGAIEANEFLVSPLPILTADPPPIVELGSRIQDPRIPRSWEILSELQKKSPEIATELSETHIGPDGNVTLHFNGGTEIHLGQRLPSRVLPVLDAFWSETEGLKNIEYAELQYQNQVAFKRRGGMAGTLSTARNSNSNR